MREIIASVRDAVKKDCLIPALALALTIPDIMGKVLYPEIVHKGKDCRPDKRDVGGQYAAWFNEWVGDKYRVPWNIPDESKPKPDDEDGAVIVVDSSKGLFGGSCGHA